MSERAIARLKKSIEKMTDAQLHENLQNTMDLLMIYETPEMKLANQLLKAELESRSRL